MSRFFDLEEFLTSSTARQKSIENLPSWEIVENLRVLAEFLDGIRSAWGSGIRVNSGFRNDRLNSAVGGVANSIHKIGFAADLYPINGQYNKFKKFIVEYLKDKQFDQCILEKKGKSEWVHLGLYDNKGRQRRQCFSMAA